MTSSRDGCLLKVRLAMIDNSSIFLDNVRLYAFHGVAEQERRVGGWFTISLRVHFNIYRAMETDSVSDTISYADLLQIVKREMAVPSQLLEHVAGRILRAVVTQFPQVERVWVKVVKDNPPMGANCDGAGVEIELSSKK